MFWCLLLFSALNFPSAAHGIPPAFQGEIQQEVSAQLESKEKLEGGFEVLKDHSLSKKTLKYIEIISCAIILLSFINWGQSSSFFGSTKSQDHLDQAKNLLKEAWHLLGASPGSETITYFEKDQNKQQMAKQMIEEAIRLQPEYAMCYQLLGSYFGAKGQWDLAIEQFNLAILKNPKFAGAFTNRGLAFMNIQKYELAIENFDKAIALDPKNAVPYYNQGLTYAEQEKFDLAQARYEKAIGLDPKHTLALCGLGNIYAFQDEFDEAIETYTKAIHIDPNHSGVFRNRGLAYLAKDEEELAKADFNQAIRLSPQDESAIGLPRDLGKD